MRNAECGVYRTLVDLDRRLSVSNSPPPFRIPHSALRTGRGGGEWLLAGDRYGHGDRERRGRPTSPGGARPKGDPRARPGRTPPPEPDRAAPPVCPPPAPGPARPFLVPRA